MSGFTGEFLGTMVLIILGVGCCAGVNLKGNYAKGSDWTFVCLAWALAVSCGVKFPGTCG